MGRKIEYFKSVRCILCNPGQNTVDKFTKIK